MKLISLLIERRIISSAEYASQGLAARTLIILYRKGPPLLM